MGDDDAVGLPIEEEERLPWLEPIEDVEPSGVSMSRLLGLVLAGLVVIGVVVGGLWWWQNVGGRPRGELIAAPEGDYKVAPPAEPGRFDGDGTVAVAASEGETAVGQVDPNRLPERPVTPAVRPAATTPRPATGATPPTAARTSTAPAATRAAPAAAAPAASTGGTSGTIQLGAFASEATAARAWDSLKSRFEWLGPVNRTIAAAEVNGRTVYRLRAAAGSASAARDLCARLRVAGENCIVLP